MTVSIKIDDLRKQNRSFPCSTSASRMQKSNSAGSSWLMMNYSLENEDTFIQNFKELPPMEEDPAWKMLENPKHWGIKDASTRIDECLYGS